MNLYDEIEPEIKDVVKLLRDNGINTTNSCGHAMWVEAEFYDDRDITKIVNLLWNSKFQIEATVYNYPIFHRSLTIKFLDKGEIENGSSRI